MVTMSRTSGNGKKRILIVDDDPKFCRLMEAGLGESGNYKVRTETDGTRAVHTAREFRPALVLLDVVMPGADGGIVAAQLQADKHLKNIPIVFLTGIVSEREVVCAGDLIGGYHFIAKPARITEVIRCIEENLEG